MLWALREAVCARVEYQAYHDSDRDDNNEEEEEGSHKDDDNDNYDDDDGDDGNDWSNDRYDVGNKNYNGSNYIKNIASRKKT